MCVCVCVVCVGCLWVDVLDFFRGFLVPYLWPPHSSHIIESTNKWLLILWCRVDGHTDTCLVRFLRPPRGDRPYPTG